MNPAIAQKIPVERLGRKCFVRLRQWLEKQAQEGLEGQLVQDALAARARKLRGNVVGGNCVDGGPGAAVAGGLRERVERLAPPVALGEIGIVDTGEVSPLMCTAAVLRISKTRLGRA
jgi:hypothetical protein